ncbi:MAG: two-component system, NarL family, captular synthesis response regulator RcsB [Glomeribacter sp. 1016415]|nr:two-component system, NarL family, captular synthesis response regulator RcsB [Glomeribacter sp. 1016415]
MAIPALTVMLLDDHPVVLDGFKTQLHAAQDIQIVGTFMTSRSLLAALRNHTCDVLLIDYSLGEHDLDGVNLVRYLSVRYEGIKILVASAHHDPATMMLVMRAGARGFFSKRQNLAELPNAIRTVASGHAYLGSQLAEQLSVPSFMLGEAAASGTGHELRTDYDNLSPREREVLRCCLDGLTLTQITEKFSRSIKTISAQKRAAYRKLGIQNDYQLFKIGPFLKQE